MKKLEDFIEIKEAPEEHENHEININSDTNILGDPRHHKIVEYFEELDKKEVSKGKKSILKDKWKVILPKNSFDLKVLIDDLMVLFNS